jgi:hypothetical protein
MRKNSDSGSRPEAEENRNCGGADGVKEERKIRTRTQPYHQQIKDKGKKRDTGNQTQTLYTGVLIPDYSADLHP